MSRRRAVLSVLSCLEGSIVACLWLWYEFAVRCASSGAFSTALLHPEKRTVMRMLYLRAMYSPASFYSGSYCSACCGVLR